MVHDVNLAIHGTTRFITPGAVHEQHGVWLHIMHYVTWMHKPTCTVLGTPVCTLTFNNYPLQMINAMSAGGRSIGYNGIYRQCSLGVLTDNDLCTVCHVCKLIHVAYVAYVVRFHTCV